MALAIAHSRGLDGLSAPPVTVEVHLASGLPTFTLVGLPDTEVKEARDRVRAAIVNSGFDFPSKRITVNLAPADLPKESGRFDLPIALGMLAASGQIPASALNDCEFAGELSLSGELRPIRGALAMALQTAGSGKTFILPEESAREAALIGSGNILAARSLLEVCAHICGRAMLPGPAAVDSENQPIFPDLNEVRGQSQAKRALEVAAAGGHSLLMIGPPGSGKSMLAARLPGLMPMLDGEAAKASAAVLSLVGQFRPEAFGVRPYRQPHHTASAVALVGGGNPPRPGEISLAHQGVLFLDEVPEFEKSVLEVLRQPMEDGQVTISRALLSLTYPAEFMMVAAMNPCPCGYATDPANKCSCTPLQVQKYLAKISGPLLDRIDIHIEVPAVKYKELAGEETGETSAQIRQRVEQARQAQLARFRSRKKLFCNARMESKDIREFCRIDSHGEELLRMAITKLGLSARAYDRILKVARTIADLAGSSEIKAEFISEAIQYRALDRSLGALAG